jgi:hypothetical protein
MQLLFPPNRVGASPGESILGISWGPRSNFLFASTYSDVELLLGHSRAPFDDLSLVFADNFDGAPTRVFSGDYVVPNSLGTAWFPWPAFTTDFEYDGARSLLLDVNVPTGASTFQLFRSTSLAAFPKIRIFGAASAPVASFGEATLYHTRFSIARLRSVAQSTFFDTGVDDADFSAAAVRTTAFPAGSELALEVEGAEDADRNGVPDPGTLTGFRTDPNAIDGSRLVRFRLGFKASQPNGEVPRVTSVAIPFR